MKKFIVLNEDYSGLIGKENYNKHCIINKVTKNKIVITQTFEKERNSWITCKVEIPLCISDYWINERLNIHGFHIERHNNIEIINDIEVFREKLISLEAELIFDERLGEYLIKHEIKGLGVNILNSIDGFQKYYKILIDFDKIKDKLEESDYLIKR